VPPIGDFLKGYEAVAWIGVGAPKDTPADIIAALNKQVNAALVDPTIKQRLIDLGDIVMPPSSPADFANFIAADAAKWSKVIKEAGIKPE
jgi:tripartite-type tricarboxylate transporter receptor subunit TctC